MSPLGSSLVHDGPDEDLFSVCFGPKPLRGPIKTWDKSMSLFPSAPGNDAGEQSMEGDIGKNAAGASGLAEQSRAVATPTRQSSQKIVQRDFFRGGFMNMYYPGPQRDAVDVTLQWRHDTSWPNNGRAGSRNCVKTEHFCPIQVGLDTARQHIKPSGDHNSLSLVSAEQRGTPDAGGGNRGAD